MRPDGADDHIQGHLDRGMLLNHALKLEGLEHRVKHLEDVVCNLNEMRSSIVKLEERLKGHEDRLEERIAGLEGKMEQWRTILWGIILMILTQIAIAAFEYFKSPK